MHDALQFERLGIPAALVITEPFQGLASRFGATLGAATYPTVSVPHPISTKPRQEIERIAERIVPSVVARLAGAHDA